MSVIILRLEGPMQSWGIGSRFTDRQTEGEPTKSGVIGLLCSALGRSREDTIDDLVKMKMIVRVEREGQVVYDYHTVRGILRANEKKELGNVVSRRFYIADACFLVGLEGSDEKLMKSIANSLRFPKWPLFLGKKSFPASSPILVREPIHQRSLIDTMMTYPWQGRKDEEKPLNLRIISECELGEGEPCLDVPISFETRTFSSRYIKTEFISFESLNKEG